MEIWWLIYILISPQTAQLQIIEQVPTKVLTSHAECMKELNRALKATTIKGEWLACVRAQGLRV